MLISRCSNHTENLGIFGEGAATAIRDLSRKDPYSTILSYVVLAPKTVRPGLTYSVSVNIRVATGPVTVSARIIAEGSKSSLVQSEITVSAGDVGIIDLEIPDTLSYPTSQYQLEVSGSGGGVSFTDTDNLMFDVTHFAMFIQTDKAIYKPGQTVNFRIFGVHPGMLPYTGPFDVDVMDPDDNIILKLTGLQNETYGVITHSMLMSSEPVLGDWTMKAAAEGQEKTKQVTIEEYEDSALNIQIDAKYTFGKPLKGTADVSIQFNYNDPSITRSVQLDGTADISLSQDEIFKLFRSFNTWSDEIYDGTEIIVSATVTEELTGLTQDATAAVSYYQKPIKVDALPISSSVFKPGLTYTAYLLVTHQDGSMLTAKERRDSLVVAFKEAINYEEQSWVRTAYSIPESGIVEATLDVDQSATSLEMKGLYYRPSSQELDSYQPNSYLQYLTKMDSPSQTYIQIAIETEQVTIGQDVTFTVTTTEIPSELTYTVISQGNIMLVDSLKALTGNVNTITLAVDARMAPRAKVIVSFVRDDGEVIADSVELQVDGIFKNQVSVSFDRDTSEPGDAITFTVEASPESFVGILAVDQSVLILKSGNDITRDEVIDELSAIGTDDVGTDSFPTDVVFRKKRSVWYPRYSPSSSAREVFNDAGLLVFSDGLVPGYVSNNYNYFLYEDELAFDAVPAQAETAGGAVREKSDSNMNAGSAIEVTVRKQFPETWLWSDIIADSNGQVIVKTTVPDTITSWLGSAFAVSLTDGLGVAEAPVKTTVFKPFFVSLNLPYSIIRGETLVLQATVFNYFDTEIQATVSLEKSTHFEGIIVDENGIEKSSSEAMHYKIGLVNLIVRAISDLAGDAVRRQLLVEPEGISHSVSETRLFNEDTDTDIEEVFAIGLPSPDELVSGSVRVLLSVTGDIMGPTMNNLDSLLKMPFGCGEQNMMNFAPDVFVYEYLTVTDQNSPEIKDKAYRFMLSGYQRELTYKHDDGSFSAFGKSDPSGSVWLTSFVAKSFTGAAKFITIDTKVIEMAGGVNPGATLTAYITIALQEVLNSQNISESIRENIQSAITRAQGYLVDQEDDVRSDPYALSLVTYALAITKSRGQKHWSSAEDETVEDEDDYWYRPYHGPPSSEVEMTSYALLTYLEMDDIPGASSIAKWMTHQRNPFGGYGSTQDTVIGLQALTAFSLIFRETDPQVDLSISLSSDPSYTHDLTVDTNNAIVLQQVELPTQSGEITVRGRGRGTCLMTVAIFYNLKAIHERRSFEYTISLSDLDQDNLEIEACGRYLGEAQVTSMCLMDIGIPSGFAADHDRLTEVTNDHPLVQKFETAQQSVYLYFQEIPKDEMTCVTLHASRTNVVANVQPKYARLYDYYNPAEQVVVEYSSDVLQGVLFVMCAQTVRVVPVVPNNLMCHSCSSWLRFW
ncbi:hypothetical protein BSL78_22928 [Apostichopus japonicus]|uniref:CD109 antigen n=1 Tax=Stichopus japonicus TaxID=307972 RepID=A0A2G8JWR5_STIJA|nr:hypothetical protein BSL78_22928 [Apostichopus japonicus]